MIQQLNPPIPLTTPKGDGFAFMVIDYSQEHDLVWVVAIDQTGEIWGFSNREVRAQKNITLGREIKQNECKCPECLQAYARFSSQFNCI